MLAISAGTMTSCSSSISRYRISATSSADATGAWKIAPMPAAAPAAANVSVSRRSRRSARATNAPTERPTCATGPSRPAEPPEPSTSAEATVLTQTTRRRICAPSWYERISALMPPPAASGANRSTKRPETKAPAAGKMISTQRRNSVCVGSKSGVSPPGDAGWKPASPPSKKCSAASTAMWNKIATPPTSTPSAT